MLRCRDNNGAMTRYRWRDRTSRFTAIILSHQTSNDDGDEGKTDDRGTVPGVGLGLGTPELGGTGRQEGDVNYSVVVTVQKKE